MQLIAEKKGHHSTTFPTNLKRDNPRARIASEGEEYTDFVSPKLGTPLCQNMYRGVPGVDPSVPMESETPS